MWQLSSYKFIKCYRESIYQNITKTIKEICGRRDEWKTSGIQEGKRNNGANICNQTTLWEYIEMIRTLYNNFIDFKQT